MAQGKQLSWNELRVGIFVLAGIIVVGLGIFYVTGTGALGAKYRLVTYLPEVSWADHRRAGYSRRGRSWQRGRYPHGPTQARTGARC